MAPKEPKLDKIYHSVLWQAGHLPQKTYFVPLLNFFIMYLKENQVYFKEIWAEDLLKKKKNYLTNHSLYITSKEQGKSENVTGRLRIPMEIWQQLSCWLTDLKLQDVTRFITSYRIVFWVENCLHYICIHFPVRTMCRIAFAH